MRLNTWNKGVAAVISVVLLTASCGITEDAQVDIETAQAEVRNTASEDLDIAEDQVLLGTPLELTPSGCYLISARDPESLSPHARNYAVLGDGTILRGQEPDAAKTVLNECSLEGQRPPAYAIAEIVIRMASTPGPLAVIDSAWARRKLDELGIENQPPTAIGDSGDVTVTFFAEDLEVDSLTRVTLTHTSDGDVDISYEDL